jgi:membrane-associated phospholipid phosphatase
MLRTILLALVCPLLLAAAMAEDVVEHEPLKVDKVVLAETPTAQPHGVWHGVMGVLSDLGAGAVPLLAASVAVTALLLGRRFRQAAFAVLAVQGATVFARVFKGAFERPRPQLTRTAMAVTAADPPGGRRVLLVGLLVVLVVIAWRTVWRPGLLLLTTVYVGWLVLEAITEQLVSVDGHNDSFPSGHAVGSMAVVATLVVLVWPTRHRWPVVVAGGVFAAAVGASRVYLGFHFPSDVLAGWSWAVAWTAAMWLFVLRRTPPPAPTLTSTSRGGGPQRAVVPAEK